MVAFQRCHVESGPIGDAPVSYILDKIQKAESEKLDIHKIDWDVTSRSAIDQLLVLLRNSLSSVL